MGVAFLEYIILCLFSRQPHSVNFSLGPNMKARSLYKLSQNETEQMVLHMLWWWGCFALMGLCAKILRYEASTVWLLHMHILSQQGMPHDKTGTTIVHPQAKGGRGSTFVNRDRR